MRMRILCVWLLWGQVCSGGDELWRLRGGDELWRLRGRHGRNHVWVCLQGVAGEAGGRMARRCGGALLHEQWAGLRAGCLRAHPQHRMFALRATDLTHNCSELADGYSTAHTRAVKALFYHPWWDLAMVMLHRPYIELDRHPNSTMWTASKTFKRHGIWRWIRNYINTFGLVRNNEYNYKRIGASMISTQAPLFAFVFSIVTPLLLLLLVFFYVINYTGSSQEVPYNILQCTKKPAQV